MAIALPPTSPLMWTWLGLSWRTGVTVTLVTIFVVAVVALIYRIIARKGPWK